MEDQSRFSSPTVPLGDADRENRDTLRAEGFSLRKRADGLYDIAKGQEAKAVGLMREQVSDWCGEMMERLGNDRVVEVAKPTKSPQS